MQLVLPPAHHMSFTSDFDPNAGWAAVAEPPPPRDIVKEAIEKEKLVKCVALEMHQLDQHSDLLPCREIIATQGDLKGMQTFLAAICASENSYSCSHSGKDRKRRGRRREAHFRQRHAPDVHGQSDEANCQALIHPAAISGPVCDGASQPSRSPSMSCPQGAIAFQQRSRFHG